MGQSDPQLSQRWEMLATIGLAWVRCSAFWTLAKVRFQTSLAFCGIQVYVSYSVYIAPTEENERSNTHSARATPLFSKRPVFNDVLFNADWGAGRRKGGGKKGGVGGSGTVWCGKLLMLFRIKLRKFDAGLVETEGPVLENQIRPPPLCLRPVV